jgi:hypothetical protein
MFYFLTNIFFNHLILIKNVVSFKFCNIWQLNYLILSTVYDFSKKYQLGEVESCIVLKNNICVNIFWSSWCAFTLLEGNGVEFSFLLVLVCIIFLYEFVWQNM